MMVAALWANTNWDGEEADRGQAIKDIEDNFNRSMQIIYTGEKEEDEEIDWNDPFFAPVKRGLDAIEVPREDEGSTITVGEALEAEKWEGLDVDQI